MNGHEIFQTAQVINIPFFRRTFSLIAFSIVGISCFKPKIPFEAKILRGSTYLYSDKVIILCGNGEVIEIYCNADGQWSLDPTQACYK